MRHRHHKSYFSLIELVAIILIFSLVAGLAVGRIQKMPVFLSLDKVISKVKLLFIEASKQSLAQGKEVSVVFDLDSKLFTLQAPQSEISMVDEEGEELDIPKPSKKKPSVYKLPEDVEFEFPETSAEDGKVNFYFYSDGSADGPEIIFKMSGHAFSMTISPLTGAVEHRELEEDF